MNNIKQKGHDWLNISKLKEGMEVKNYKQLCELLEIEIKKSGNSRNAQIKEMERYFSYSKKGHKFIITEIYSSPTIKRNNSYSYFTETSSHKLDKLVDTYGLDTSSLGTYTKQLVRWLCEKCNKQFDSTMKQISKHNDVVCKVCRMSKGARNVYEILNKLSLNVKTEYYFNDLIGKERPLRFDFAILENGHLICLIEYDGGYHDDGGQDEYDNLKNIYCKNKSIPLIRIHHSDKDIEEIITNSLDAIKTGVNINTYRIGRMIDEINFYKNKIEELEIKVKELILNGEY